MYFMNIMRSLRGNVRGETKLTTGHESSALRGKICFFFVGALKEILGGSLERRGPLQHTHGRTAAARFRGHCPENGSAQPSVVCQRLGQR